MDQVYTCRERYGIGWLHPEVLPGGGTKYPVSQECVLSKATTTRPTYDS